MKQRIEPSNKEWFLPEGEIIVSKTDIKGRITYGNETFISISGYQEEEIIGKQHNIVRHPDMPRGVFRLLWEAIQAGREFNGYVKNLRKDGGFYWVFANVTPSYDVNGRLVGHYSVRRKPKKEALNIVTRLYKEMLVAEQQSSSQKAIEASLNVLNSLLKEKRVSYDEFVFSL